MGEQSGSVSVVRLLAVILPVAALAFGIQHFVSAKYEDTARKRLESDILARLLGPASAGPDNAIDFSDADGDLVTDPPADDQCRTPELLIFSHVAVADPGDQPAEWQEVVEALGERLGIPAEYKNFTSTADQLAALAAGELHVLGVNTGAVPLAVATGGFVPVCTFGREDGGFGYKMQLIVPADSPVQSPTDLQDKKIAFVRPNSNSGCKAAIVLLKNEYQLLPESGYAWSFTLGHEQSILGVASGKLDAAPVASDILEGMVAAGEVDPQAIRVVYESERFPPAALGYAHDLAPGLREAVAEVLLGFEWAGTGLEGNYGGADASKFVSVSYKDDWANIRRIDNAVLEARTLIP